MEHNINNTWAIAKGDDERCVIMLFFVCVFIFLSVVECRAAH